jgi:hypothetical protein
MIDVLGNINFLFKMLTNMHYILFFNIRLILLCHHWKSMYKIYCIISYIVIIFIFLVFPCFILVICAFFHICVFLMELSLLIKNLNLSIPYLFTYLIKKFCRVYPDSDFWNKWVKTFFITWKFIMVNINLEIIILIKVWLLNKKKTWSPLFFVIKG